MPQGTLANDGHGERAFDPPQQFAREQALFGKDTQFANSTIRRSSC